MSKTRDSKNYNKGSNECYSAEEASAEAREILSTQIEILKRARRDVQSMSILFNARSNYFRQIQTLSDAVADIPSTNIVEDIRKLDKDENKAHLKVGELERRIRYLEHLTTMQQKDGEQHELQECFMCTERIVRGVLTDKCGHITCESCFNEWTRTRNQCPMCNTRLTGPSDYHRILYGRPNAVEGKEGDAAEDDSGSTKTLDLTAFNLLENSLRSQVEKIPHKGKFGSKIDLLIKHILHIANTDHSKSLVFSSFSLGLDVVATALRANGVKYARLDGGGVQGGRTIAQFRKDAEVQVLLLHSEAQSSGLNLLCATNIFLLEPLVDFSLELQAVGRVHRIGQTRETRVFAYFVLDTVEERIIALAREQRRSLYTKRGRGRNGVMVLEEEEDDEGAENINGAVVAAAASQDGAKEEGWGLKKRKERGDYVSSKRDLFKCFFGTSGEVRIAQET